MSGTLIGLSVSFVTNTGLGMSSQTLVALGPIWAQKNIGDECNILKGIWRMWVFEIMKQCRGFLVARQMFFCIGAIVVFISVVGIGPSPFFFS